MNLALTRQMVSAEVLRLRRNRALMAFAFGLSSVMVVVVFGYVAIRHGQNPLNEPAGGTDGLRRGLKLLGLFMGTLIAALIGTEAGTADLSSGVFRDLVATGRSRLALFAVRLPGALLVTWAFIAIGYVLTIVGTFVFADGSPTPSIATILDGAVWLLAANAVTVAIAVGLGSITGSRGLTLTAVIGFQTVVTQVLAGLPSLGSARDALVLPALSTRMPLGTPFDGIAMSAVTAIVILAAWAAVPTVLGAWRTQTRDA